MVASSEAFELDLGEIAQVQFHESPSFQEASMTSAERSNADMETAFEAAPPAFQELPAASEIEATSIEAPDAFEEEAAELQEESLAFEETTDAAQPIVFVAVEEEEAEEEVVEHAELPESEMLSLEDFLKQSATAPASFEFDEALPEDEPASMVFGEAQGAGSADSPAFTQAVSPSVDEAVLPATEEAFDASAAAELAPEIEQAPEALESADIRHESVDGAEPEAMPEVEVFAEAFDAATPAEAAQAEAAQAEASDAALASMIAAYPPDEDSSAEVTAPELAGGAETHEAGGVFSAEELANADSLLGDALETDSYGFEVVADSGDGEADTAPSATPEAADAPSLVVSEDDYYGMSLDELEAMTAPGAERAPAEASPPAAAQEVGSAVEADGFIDLPSISEVPAWTGESELPEASAPTAVEQSFDATAMPEAEFEATPEPEPEALLAESAIATEPEIAVESEVEAEVEAEAIVAVEPEAPAEVLEAAATADEEVFQDEAEEAQDEPEQARAPAPMPKVEQVRAARPSVPTARDEADPEADLDVTDLDTELLDLFLEETNDILDHSDGMLARLRDRIDDRETIVNLQRDLHTLKGGARMAGIYAVGELGHAMESLLESVAEGRQKLDATGVVVLERGFDRLHGMVARIGSRKAIALPAGLIAQVEALSEGKSLSEVPADEGSAPAPAPAEATKAAATEAPALNPLSAPVEEVGAEDEMSGVRAPQEQVRIRADLLDRLVNYAGEVAIYRARLEQQLGAFRANLGELDQTTTRLREQLRRLDIETEAQIIARYQREGDESDERFDPLELDRFTNQQQLTRGLNESANDLVNLQAVLDELTRQYETLLLQQSRVSSDLQEGLMRTRMVPFDALVPRLRRVLRQAAIDTGKQVQLRVDGASGEMDRNVLDRMTAPLEHMLRNAMAHGLELPEERRKARKPEEGTVRIAVQREGSEVVLKVADDGRGLNREAIRRKAIERGLIKADAEMSDEALYGMILEAGFSTAETVSRLSGRGVGMDVVYSEIRQLGGTLQITSVEGKESEFVIRLPFTLAVTQAVFVKIGETNFAVPIASVRGVGRIARADLEKQLASETPVFSYAGEDYAIHDLGTLIGHAPAKAQDSLQMPLLLARSGDLRTAILIDQVLGSREIVVKPVGPQVNSVPGIFGATIMGDGRVVVILDVAPLVRRHMAVVRDALPVAPVAAVPMHRVPVVMVVDDSITMRKVTGRVLERNNMEVLTAKDGVDAVEKMAERVPDLVLLDIEMPRMDGYEVAQNMKSDPRLKDVPIIMITSRTGDKHRQRAMDIGVDRYLGKPYQELELMRNVFDVLGMEAVND